MICLIVATGDIRRSVATVCCVHFARAGIFGQFFARRTTHNNIAHCLRTLHVARRTQRKRTRPERTLHVDRTVLDAAEQGFQIADVLVGDVYLRIQQLGDFESRAHLRDLQDLLGCGGVAVDGDIADRFAIGDARSESGKLHSCAVLSEIEIDHFAVLVKDPGVLHRRDVLLGSRIVVVQVTERRNGHTRRIRRTRTFVSANYGASNHQSYDNDHNQCQDQCSLLSGRFHLSHLIFFRLCGL